MQVATWFGERAKHVDAVTGLLALAAQVVEAGTDVLGKQDKDLAELQLRIAELQDATAAGVLSLQALAGNIQTLQSMPLPCQSTGCKQLPSSRGQCILFICSIAVFPAGGSTRWSIRLDRYAPLELTGRLQLLLDTSSAASVLEDRRVLQAVLRRLPPKERDPQLAVLLAEEATSRLDWCCRFVQEESQQLQVRCCLPGHNAGRVAS